MAKYKICPHCKHHNRTLDIECIKCYSDLSGVKPTDDDNELVKFSLESTKNDGSTSQVIIPAINNCMMMRVCDSCGFHNPPNAQKCRCGEDISDIQPTPETDFLKTPNINCTSDTTSINPITRFFLQADDGFIFNIAEDCLIGSENIMSEYLSQKPYVSRKHAELRIRENRLFIKNLSNTNYTFINNSRIGTDFTELKNGDELSLGGIIINGVAQAEAAYFTVRIN